MVEQRKRVEKCMRELVLLAKNKEGYTKDSVMNIICICCSKQMKESGYSSEEALRKAIDLVKTKPKPDVYAGLLSLVE